ncbi:hypothetical protein ABZ863_06055 [Saccharomonospora sp. NPDC046836]|uniref:hypothetical protein n=1 Tax=Saccharomonospora sp. NPDC046836 TaxID=3156921 RepID=UPI0033F340A8
MALELTPDQTRLLRQALTEAREREAAIRNRANSDFDGIAGVQWRGATVGGMIGLNDSRNEKSRRLRQFIDELEAKVLASENAFVGLDQNQEQQARAAMSQIESGGMNFGRMNGAANV